MSVDNSVDKKDPPRGRGMLQQGTAMKIVETLVTWPDNLQTVPCGDVRSQVADNLRPTCCAFIYIRIPITVGAGNTTSIPQCTYKTGGDSWHSWSSVTLHAMPA